MFTYDIVEQTGQVPVVLASFTAPWSASVPIFNAAARAYFAALGGGAQRALLLYAMLKAGHKDVKLTGDEMRRLVIWMDSNGLFHGHDQELLAQAEGKVVPPSMQ